jgi:hypothetical protein
VIPSGSARSPTPNPFSCVRQQCVYHSLVGQNRRGIDGVSRSAAGDKSIAHTRANVPITSLTRLAPGARMAGAMEKIGALCRH